MAKILNLLHKFELGTSTVFCSIGDQECISAQGHLFTSGDNIWIRCRYVGDDGDGGWRCWKSVVGNLDARAAAMQLVSEVNDAKGRLVRRVNERHYGFVPCDAADVPVDPNFSAHWFAQQLEILRSRHSDKEPEPIPSHMNEIQMPEVRVKTVAEMANFRTSPAGNPSAPDPGSMIQCLCEGGEFGRDLGACPTCGRSVAWLETMVRVRACELRVGRSEARDADPGQQSPYFTIKDGTWAQMKDGKWVVMPDPFAIRGEDMDWGLAGKRAMEILRCVEEGRWAQFKNGQWVLTKPFDASDESTWTPWQYPGKWRLATDADSSVDRAVLKAESAMLTRLAVACGLQPMQATEEQIVGRIGALLDNSRELIGEIQKERDETVARYASDLATVNLCLENSLAETQYQRERCNFAFKQLGAWQVDRDRAETKTKGSRR